MLHTHTHPFNGPLSRTTRMSWYQKGTINLDFTEARDSEWQWHQLGHMQVCTSLQTDNHASTHHSVFLQAGCPSCRPTNSVKALKAKTLHMCKVFVSMLCSPLICHRSSFISTSLTASLRAKPSKIVTCRTVSCDWSVFFCSH